jgi:hypothetical protein
VATIESYSFGRIVLDGAEHTRDVIILPDRVVSDWWRKDGHSLILEDLDDVLDELPGHLLIGTGAQGQMRPQQQAIDELKARGITVEVLTTGDAVARYGELNPAAAAAALHLTC